MTGVVFRLVSDFISLTRSLGGNKFDSSFHAEAQLRTQRPTAPVIQFSGTMPAFAAATKAGQYASLSQAARISDTSLFRIMAASNSCEAVSAIAAMAAGAPNKALDDESLAATLVDSAEISGF